MIALAGLFVTSQGSTVLAEQKLPVERVVIPVDGSGAPPPPIPQDWLQERGVNNLTLKAIAGWYAPQGTGDWMSPTQPTMWGWGIALIFEGDNGKQYIVTNDTKANQDIGGYKMKAVEGRIAEFLGISRMRPDAPHWVMGQSRQEGLDSSYSAFAAYVAGALERAGLPLSPGEAMRLGLAADPGRATNPRSWAVVEVTGIATPVSPPQSPKTPTPEKSDTPNSLTPTASATRKATPDICPDPPCTTATPTTTVTHTPTHTPTNTPTATPTITRTPVTPTREITATPATPIVPTPQKESLPAVYEVQDKFKVEFWPPFPLVVGQDRKGDLWIRRGVDYRITLRIPAWMPALKDNCPFCCGKIGDMGPCEDGWGYTPDRAIIHPVPGPGGSYVRYRRVTGLYIEARLRPESVAWIQGELARKYPGAKVYQELYVLADWRDPEGLRPGMRLGPERNLVVESVRDIAQNGRYYTEVVLRQGPGPEPGNPQGRSPWSSERHDPNRPTSVQFRDPGNYDFVVRVTSQVPQSAGCPEPELPGGVAKTGEECWSRLGPDDPWNPYFGPCERMREPIQEEFRPNQPLVVYLVDTTLLDSW
jgi:hypothetical protein